MKLPGVARSVSEWMGAISTRSRSWLRSKRYIRTARRGLRAAAVVVVLCWVTVFIGNRCVPLPPELFQPGDLTLTLLDRVGSEIAVVPSERARSAERVALVDMGAWLPKITVALED